MFIRDEQAALFDVTPIENMFIEDFLPEAKGDYVKVYIKLLHACRFGDVQAMDKLADALYLPQDVVEAALRFWERRGLIARVSDAPPSYRVYSVAQRMATAGVNRAEDEFVQFSDDMYALCRDRRDLHANEISQVYEWVTDFELPREVVLMLVDHLMRTRGPKCRLKLGDPLATAMQEENVTTCEEAELFFTRDQNAREGARAVLRRLGKRRQPSDPEIDQYTLWTREWGFPHEAIMAACEETVKGEPTMAYLGGILRGLKTRAGQASQKAEQIDSQIRKEKELRDAVSAFYRALGIRLNAVDDARIAEFLSLREMYPDTILLQAAHEVQRAGGTVDGVRSTLALWKQLGYRTDEEVRAYLEDAHATSAAVSAVFAACGITGMPTGADRKRYKKWMDMGFSQAVLLLAAEKTRAAGAKIPYLEKVLSGWKAAGALTPEAVRALAPSAPEKGGQPAKKIDALQYPQREYGPEMATYMTPGIFDEDDADEKRTD